MPHSKATFTSISLSPFISKSSSKTIIKELNNDNGNLFYMITNYLINI